jgi:hypothetical protein
MAWFFDHIYDDRHAIITRCVNHDSMFIQMSKRMSDFTIRHALISVIGDETHKHTHTDTRQAKGIIPSII